MSTERPHELARRDSSPSSRRSGGAEMETRELFWQNVMRELLTTLSTMTVQRHASPYDPEAERLAKETFDGRLAVVTRLGQRIPIAEVHPLFACSVPDGDAERALSMAVQCTIFQFRTPSGEVHTLPLSEIRGFHALTGELIERIERLRQLREKGRKGAPSDQPFGFAAFTSSARAQLEETHQSETGPPGEGFPRLHPPVGPGLAPDEEE